MARRPFVEQFSSGYVQRVVHLLPKQGDRDPWRQPQRYDDDRALVLDAPIEDGVMQFTRIPAGDRQLVSSASTASSALKSNS
jgi:hypothetical protein